MKKSGRTTGLSRSSIVGLNATISVTYDNECAGGTAFTKTFIRQIVIGNKASRFLNSGDSGSLMVEDVATNPRAIGLLFVGSSTDAIANPINQVLSLLTATMVGQWEFAVLQFGCPFVAKRTGTFCLFPFLFPNSSLGTDHA